jgi:hypothetical protein
MLPPPPPQPVSNSAMAMTGVFILSDAPVPSVREKALTVYRFLRLNLAPAGLSFGHGIA